MHGGGGGHGGAHQVGASTGALAAFEVAVASAGAALARLQAVGVHGQAHGAAGFAPFEARGHKNLVQAFALGLLLDEARAGHHHGQLHIAGHLAAQVLHHGGGFAHVFDAAIGATADEHLVDGDVVDGLAGLQAHVGERALDGAAFVGVLFLVRVGHAGVHAQHHFWRGAPGDLRHDVGGVELDDGVEHGVRIRVQRLPVGRGLVPLHAGGRQGAAFDVFNGLVVHGHQARARTGLDGHIANGHAAFHAHGAEDGARKLDGVARAARRADLADDGQHHVLGCDALGQRAVHLYQHVLGLLGQQSLRGHHVLDLAGADAVRQRAEGAVRGGVRVAAHHRHARQGGAVFGANHVHDALALVHEGEERRRRDLRHVVVQRGDLFLADGVGNTVVALLPARRGRVVVGRGHDGAHAPDLAAGFAQAFKSLGTGHFVHQMAVDVEDGGAVLLGVDDMLVPDLVVQGASHGGSLF